MCVSVCINGSIQRLITRENLKLWSGQVFSNICIFLNSKAHLNVGFPNSLYSVEFPIPIPALTEAVGR